MLAATLYNDDLLKSYSFYKKAVECVQPMTDKALLADLYFKYALCCDDVDETEDAVLYYRKCSEIEKNNPHLASALSNLALIFEETGMSELAFKYYVKSLEVDEAGKNNNGIYASCIKLAEMSARKYPEKAEMYLKKAIASAEILNDDVSKFAVYLQYGDFYLNHKNIRQAMKYYLIADTFTTEHQDIKQKVLQRMNDLRVRLGSEFEDMRKELQDEK